MSSFWGIVFYMPNIILLGLTTTKKHYSIEVQAPAAPSQPRRPAATCFKVCDGNYRRVNKALKRVVSDHLVCPIISPMLPDLTQIVSNMSYNLNSLKGVP